MATRDSFVAIDAGTDLRGHARLLRRVWEASLAGNRGPVEPRSVIEQSWARMQRAGLDPDHLRPRPALDAEALDAARAASALAAVMPLLRRCLAPIALDAEHVLVVCDAGGRILWLEGHPAVKDAAAERIAFTEGMLWTEDSAGTNAIGTALAIDHAVQVFSAEHFLAEQHAWWCSAAPLHDPVTGELLGIVDLSGPMRTAHPRSLGFVSAAAGMAEEALRLHRAAEDDRRRRAYVERTVGLGRARARSAVVGPDGRVLMTQPSGWIDGAVALPAGARSLPAEGGEITLADGRRVVAEPLAEGGHVLWAVKARTRGLTLHLELLGRAGLTARVGSAEPLRLGLRQAEILALLALSPAGLTCEQLTLELYGDEGNPISTRALLSRLRRQLGPLIGARPYRFAAEVDADFLRVERLLRAGDLLGALDAYRAPLLAESEAPRIVQARDELEGALRRAAIAGGPDTLWAWLESGSGRDDLAALQDYLRAVTADDPRRAIAAARLRALQLRWRTAA